MTFQHSQRPHEAAQNPLTEATPAYGQVLQKPLFPSPKPANQTCPDKPISYPGPSGEIIRHIIVGSPEAIRETIYRLHMLRYVEHPQWTGPIEIGPSGIHITPEQGQMLAYLMRLRAFDAPTG